MSVVLQSQLGVTSWGKIRKFQTAHQAADWDIASTGVQFLAVHMCDSPVFVITLRVCWCLPSGLKLVPQPLQLCDSQPQASCSDCHSKAM